MQNINKKIQLLQNQKQKKGTPIKSKKAEKDLLIKDLQNSMVMIEQILQKLKKLAQ